MTIRWILGVLCALPFAQALMVAVPIVAHGYDCDVHLVRAIRSQPGGTPRQISLRDECFQASDSAAVEWPLCQCNNSGDVISDQTKNNCSEIGLGYTELGRCVRSKLHYRSYGGDRGPYDPTVFRSFVPNAAICEPCAHDIASAVYGCHRLCERYFDGRYFHKSDKRQDKDGSWKIMTAGERSGADPLPANTLGLVDDPNWDPDDDPQTTNVFLLPDPDTLDQVTVAEYCRRRCGPPNGWKPANSPDTPQSVWFLPGDHWHFVNNARWNGNESLDGWLRSYTVNTDKPDAPRKECNATVHDYCDAIDAIADAAGDTMTISQVGQCKKARLLRLPEINDNIASLIASGDLPPGTTWDLAVDYERDTYDFTTLGFARYADGCHDGTVSGPAPLGNRCDVPELSLDLFKDVQLHNDTFCDHFARGNYMCSQTCYHIGDGGHNPFHKCCHSLNDNGTPGNPGDDYCAAGGIIRDTDEGKCIGPAVDATRRGGAVCEVPPVTNAPGVSDVNKVKIVTPAKQSACGSPSAAGANPMPSNGLLVFYTGSSGVIVGPNLVPPDHVAKAVWENRTNGEAGTMVQYVFGLWRANRSVPLQTGVTNVINVRFTDRALQTTGDVIEITPPP